MAIIGLQGLRGGTGTTSITAALAWALQKLGESVLVIDASSDNMLRLFFDVKISRSEGWAHATLNNQNWQESGWRYTPNLDILPFGSLNSSEIQTAYSDPNLCDRFNEYVTILKNSQRYKWILVDLPALFPGMSPSWMKNIDNRIVVAQPDSNGLLRVSQRLPDEESYLLVNGLQTGSQLQDDIYQVWLFTQQKMIPVVFHADEAMAESCAMKKPVGEYSPHALTAEEATTLANWCLANLTGQRT